MSGQAESHDLAEVARKIADTILIDYRWFLDGNWVIFEVPDHSLIPLDILKRVADVADVADVAAVFRFSPHVGIYVRFRLVDV